MCLRKTQTLGSGPARTGAPLSSRCTNDKTGLTHLTHLTPSSHLGANLGAHLGQEADVHRFSRPFWGGHLLQRPTRWSTEHVSQDTLHTALLHGTLLRDFSDTPGRGRGL